MAEHVLHMLMNPPEAVGHAAAILAGLDRCLLVGFGRLGPDQTQALEALGRVCGDSPLGPALGESLAALGRLEFVERHFTVLAAARVALQGAQHNTLRLQAAEALGRPLTDEPAPRKPAVDGPVAVWCESTRHWLMELALAGFKNLDGQAIAPFSATLEHLQGEPRLARLAALLIGFQRELLHALPIATLPVLPLYRWADLWSRGLIATLDPIPTPASRAVSGRLSPLGIDLREHAHFLSADVFALLEEPGAEPGVVRATVSAYKVDAVRGDEVWNCFSAAAQLLLRAPLDGHALEVEGMTLLETGDLVWDGQAKIGPSYSPMAIAAQWLAPGRAVATPVVSPADRHPVQLAEPVYLEGYQMSSTGALALGWGDSFRLPVAVQRPLPAPDAKADLVTRSSIVRDSEAMIGLLRFDGGSWSVQPLAVRKAGGKCVDTFVGPAAEVKSSTKKKKGDVDTLAILRERAGRLLRKKS